eukprot:s419_g34.t1
MSPLEPGRAERNEELPELRKCDGKLTPRSRPPTGPARRIGSFHDHVLDSPTSDQTSTGGAYPEVAPPVSCFAPRPPAELPSRSTGRRAQGERATCQTPRQKGGSTSLPPVPLTARERHWQSSDPGASGSSVSSARRSLPERDGRSSSQHARTVTGAPSKDPKSCATVVQVVVPAGNRPGRWQEPGSNSEPSRKLAQTTKPPSRETASPVFAGYASAPSPESRESREGEGEGGVAWEMPSCPSPAILDVLSDALGQEDARRNSFWEATCFHDIITVLWLQDRDGAREGAFCLVVTPVVFGTAVAGLQELWNEKMVALLSSSPNPPVADPDPSQLPSDRASATEAEVPSERDVAPPPLTVEPLKELEKPHTSFKLSMASSHLPVLESTSMVDLFATASDADLAEEISEASTSRGGWRSSSRNWAAQMARRKKERCSSGRATPCSDV